MNACLTARSLAFSLGALGALAPVAHAQVILGAARFDTSAPIATGTAKPAPNTPGSQSTIKSILSRGGPLLTWGPLAVRPHTSYSITRSNGLLRVPGLPTNTIQHTVTQGLLLELGSTWTLDGTVTRSMYSTKALSTTTDGSGTLAGRWTVNDWQFAVSQHVSSGAPIIVETGSQNKERLASTRAEARYRAGDKTSLTGAATWSRRKAAPQTRNAAWTGSNWDSTNFSTGVDYALSRRVQLSGTFDVGYDRISDNPDMSYYGPNARISWRPTDRLSVSGGAGYESRTTEGTGGRTFRTPTYNAAISYSPTLTTTLTVSASRNVATSYFNDQTIRGESQSASVSQRLLKRFFLSATYGTGQSDYLANIGAPGLAGTSRADRFRSISASLGTGFGTRGSVSLTASESRNRTSAALFRQSTNSIGANVSYRF